MKQFNQSTNWERAIKKEPKVSTDEIQSMKELKLLKYEKANIYNEEKPIYSNECVVEICTFSKKFDTAIEVQQKLNKAMEVQKEIVSSLKENFEDYKKRIPLPPHRQTNRSPI